MKVVPYDEKYKKDFVEMNLDWISEIFTVEAEDKRELTNIEHYIENGGQIFFALNDEGAVMASCMVAPREDGDWEIMKFAAKSEFAGSGAGNACLKACIEYAESLHLPKLIIVSNRKCLFAVHLYRKFGFTEIPVDKERFPFERGDIVFEKEL